MLNYRTEHTDYNCKYGIWFVDCCSQHRNRSIRWWVKFLNRIICIVFGLCFSNLLWHLDTVYSFRWKIKCHYSSILDFIKTQFNYIFKDSQNRKKTWSTRFEWHLQIIKTHIKNHIISMTFGNFDGFLGKYWFFFFFSTFRIFSSVRDMFVFFLEYLKKGGLNQWELVDRVQNSRFKSKEMTKLSLPVCDHKNHQE